MSYRAVGGGLPSGSGEGLEAVSKVFCLKSHWKEWTESGSDLGLSWQEAALEAAAFFFFFFSVKMYYTVIRENVF